MKTAIIIGIIVLVIVFLLYRYVGKWVDIIIGVLNQTHEEL